VDFLVPDHVERAVAAIAMHSLDLSKSLRLVRLWDHHFDHHWVCPPKYAQVQIPIFKKNWTWVVLGHAADVGWSKSHDYFEAEPICPIVDRLQEPGSLANVQGRPRAIQHRTGTGFEPVTSGSEEAALELDLGVEFMRRT
jgi:hypothetical protein